MHLIDSHCHLTELTNIKEEIVKASENNVKTIISNSVDLNSMKKNLELKKQFKEIKIALGIHPSNIVKISEKEIIKGIEFIKTNIKNNIAVGEIGLDFKDAKNKKEREIQRKYFKEFIEIGKKFNKPLIIHSRYAGKNILEILKENNAKKVLMHWFLNSEKEIKKAIELNYYISITPNIIFSEHKKELIKQIPLKQLLFETDAPARFNEQYSKPFWVKKIAEKTSEIFNLTLKEITKISYNNAKTLFSL